MARHTCVFPNCRNGRGSDSGVCDNHRWKLRMREYSPVDAAFLDALAAEELLEHKDFVTLAVEQAKCRDLLFPDKLFFPEVGQRITVSHEFCEDCPMRLQCASFAVANKEPHGIWGGLSTIDRRAVVIMLKERREVAA